MSQTDNRLCISPGWTDNRILSSPCRTDNSFFGQKRDRQN